MLELVLFVAIFWVPALVLLGGHKLATGSRRALVATTLVTWAVTTFVLAWFVPEGPETDEEVLFFLIAIPCVGVPVAALVATRLVRTSGRLIQALLLAALGWFLGLVALLVFLWMVIPHAANDPVIVVFQALLLGMPVNYASSGAVLAAGLGGRRA